MNSCTLLENISDTLGDKLKKGDPYSEYSGINKEKSLISEKPKEEVQVVKETKK